MATMLTADQRLDVRARAFFALLIIMAVQNIVAMVLARFNSPAAQAAFVAKELYIAAVISISMLTVILTGRLNREAVFPLGLIAYLLSVSVLGSPYFNLVSLRQALIIPVFIMFGVWFADKADIGRIAKWVFPFYVTIVLLGFVERFVLYDQSEVFFKALGVREWANMKGWGYGIPGSWYSTDLVPWIGRSIRRMPGLLIGDAVNFGQAMAFPFVLAVLLRRYMVAAIIFMAMLFGLSKGALLAGGLGVTMYIAFERLRPGPRYAFFGAVMLAGAVVIYLSLDLLRQVASIMDHFRGGYVNALDVFDNPFGSGVGSGGNFGRRFNISGTADAFGLSTARFSDYSGLAYGESYFGTMVAQFGFVGLFMYIYYPIRLLRTRLSKDALFLQAVKYTALALFVVGLVSETAFTYIGTGFLVALVPFVLQADRNKLARG
jgi:hypothetical protein